MLVRPYHVVVEVLLVDDTDDLIDFFLIYRDSRKAGLFEDLRQFLFGAVYIDGDHFGPRRHNFFCGQLVELDGVLDELAPLLIDPAAGLGFFDHGQDLVIRDGILFVQLEQFGDQLLPLAENKGDRRQHSHEETDERRREFGERFRLLLGDVLRCDLTENKHNNSDHDG